MDEENMKKLSKITCKLIGMTAVLHGYCENYSDDIPELANLVEFSEILNNTSQEIFHLL